MFSPEFMSFLIKYQMKDYVNKSEKFIVIKNSEFKSRIHRFTKFAVAPVKAER